MAENGQKSGSKTMGCCARQCLVMATYLELEKQERQKMKRQMIRKQSSQGNALSKQEGDVMGGV